MAWESLKLDSGTLREAAVYSKMTDRSDQLISYYMPIVGGTSPLTRFRTTSASYVPAFNVIVTPCTCQFVCRILYEVTAGGAGYVKVFFDGVSYSAEVNSTSPDAVLFQGVGLKGTGDPEKAVVSALASSGTITVYSVIMYARPGGYTTGMTEIPPDPAALASGLPISTEFMRRLVAAPVYLMKSRLAALAYFAHADARTAATSMTIPTPLNVSGSFDAGDFTDLEFKVSVIAPTSSTVYLRGQTVASISPSSATTIATSGAMKAKGFMMLEFDGPVESFVVYQHA